jgi:uncharacterized membrane protein
MTETITVGTAGETLTFPNEPVMGRQLLGIKKFWAGFHNSVIIALLFTMLGIGIGVKVSKDYYSEKMSDVVATGAMLLNSKVYVISPKL